MRKVTLCNNKGETMCGTDGHLNIDGRYGLIRTLNECYMYRERFKANFPHKYQYWTHVLLNRTGRIIPLLR